MNTNKLVGGVAVKTVSFEGVECFDIAAVVAVVCPDYQDQPYRVWQAKVKEWCQANAAHHYQEDREFFGISGAASEALMAGKRRVVMEDMS